MRRNFIKGKSALSGVIEALLLIALVAVVLGIVQYEYIPQVMSEREADHMDEVENQFYFLKSVIDLQGMTEKDVPIVSPIILGNDAFPYFVSAGAMGEVQIIDGNEYEIKVHYNTLSIPLTSIKFIAYNFYYLSGGAVTYTIEGGAIILNQTTGNPDTTGENAIVEPAIKVENLTNDINIYYDIPIIKGITGKKQSDIRRGTINIRTNYSSSDDFYLPKFAVDNINITTDYPTAWYDLMQDLLKDNVDYEIGNDYVEIKKKVKTINFYYKRIYIYAQIGPGWTK